MENVDIIVLRTMLGWRAAGQRALLVTVVRTWGSSPRPVGSLMALSEGGAVVGSVSGGCVEDDLLARYVRADAADALPRSGPPQRLKYGVTADEAHRFGLPCGGTLELVLECDPDPASLRDLVQRLEGGQLVRRSVDLASERVTLMPADAPAALTVDRTTLTNTFGPAYRMLIIGAGQMSAYLAGMAQSCGFAVTVCDPRAEHRQSWSLPQVRVETGMPDDVVLAFRPDRRSCVVALTHDPKLDDLALLEALATPAFYVGAIGSRRNHAARRQRMIEHLGQTESGLRRLRGPIGIFIGSKTPPEIAVSIMAEVLAVKNGVTLPRELEVEHAKLQLEAAAKAAPDVPGAADDASACAGPSR